MALKLRRQAGLFTNGILPHWISERPPDLLRTGAASSKRVLGSRRLRATGRRLRTALNEIVQANTKEERSTAKTRPATCPPAYAPEPLIQCPEMTFETSSAPPQRTPIAPKMRLRRFSSLLGVYPAA